MLYFVCHIPLNDSDKILDDPHMRFKALGIPPRLPDMRLLSFDMLLFCYEFSL